MLKLNVQNQDARVFDSFERYKNKCGKLKYSAMEVKDMFWYKDRNYDKNFLLMSAN